jgi:hypothetical protein
MRNKLLGSILIPLALLGLQACGPNPLSFLQPSYKAQEDCGFVQNVYGERISWKGKTPIIINVHESFPPQFNTALENAMKKWEVAVGHPLFQLGSYGVKGPMTPRQDGVNLIYMMNTWEEDKSSEQARTSVYWVGDTIKEADIRINSKNFTFYSDRPASNSDVHIESILVHELGHVFGLKHKDGGGSVMGTYLASMSVRTVISSTDLNSMRCEY